MPDNLFYMQKLLQGMMGGKGGKGKGRKGKGVMKSGKKSGGKGRTRVPYSELSDERKEEIRAKHEARAVEEGREEDTSGFHFGTLEKRAGTTAGSSYQSRESSLVM